MEIDKIDKAIKETFKTKVEQKEQMFKFQAILKDLNIAKEEVELHQSKLKMYFELLEGFFDMIGLNKLSKQEWREKYILSEKKEQVKE